MPSNGYTIPYDRDLVGSNTLLYIYPMKSCLPLDKPTQPVTDSPLTKCPKCTLSIPIMQSRKHSSPCSGIEVSNSDSSDEKDFERSVFESSLPDPGKDESVPIASSAVVEPVASSSIRSSSINAGIASSKTLFPNERIEDLREA